MFQKGTEGYANIWHNSKTVVEKFHGNFFQQTLTDTVVLFLIESQKARLVFATFLQN